MTRRTDRKGPPMFNLRARKREKTRVAGCVDHICRPDAPHGSCIDCGRVTDSRRLQIDPTTLRCRLMHICDGCVTAESSTRRLNQQERLATQRTLRDWNHVTDPVNTGALRTGVMPEQIPGPTREAIRAFWLSGAAVAVATVSDAATLNNAIATLGLHDDMYAEIRSGEVVLRRLDRKAEGRR
jgi:hypothetical protein